MAATEVVDEPMMSFARLRESSSLDDVTEVDVPTRFMIIILGPTELHAELHEIGRCISTLMSDEVIISNTLKSYDWDTYYDFYRYFTKLPTKV